MEKEQIEMLLDLVKHKSENEARIRGAWSLGDLYDALVDVPRLSKVVMDTGLEPVSLMSYRGYYDRLSIASAQTNDNVNGTRLVGGGGLGYGDYFPGASHVDIAEASVHALIQALDLAEGETFEGYKGGQYTMYRSTLIHAAPYGSTDREICGLVYDEKTGTAVIVTQEEEW